MQTKRSSDFTEEELNRVQQYGGDRGCHTNVRYLADTAGRFIMPIGV
ncbi:MAG TPA: hypothetical protein VFI45_03820 [Candidatus Acidoferrum sp.]|nr:hypothetical protein [Candidatus Acidoferrum sp.]